MFCFPVTLPAGDYAGFVVAAVKKGTKEQVGRWLPGEKYSVKSCSGKDDTAVNLQK